MALADNITKLSTVELVLEQCTTENENYLFTFSPSKLDVGYGANPKHYCWKCGNMNDNWWTLKEERGWNWTAAAGKGPTLAAAGFMLPLLFQLCIIMCLLTLLYWVSTNNTKHFISIQFTTNSKILKTGVLIWMPS